MSAELLCVIMFLVTFGVLLAGFPVAFTLAGCGLIFAFLGSAMGLLDFAILSAFPQRLFAIMTNEVLVAVPLFVFMGVMLERSRVAEDLLDDMGQIFGPLRGGIGYAVCIVGALLAASTGIVGATVVTMGLLSLPVMLRRRYDPALASGTIAAAGTLGQIIPPSIVLVLLGDQLSAAYQKAQFARGVFAPESLSVNDLFAGALLPGLLLVALYLLYIFTVTKVRPESAPPIPRAEQKQRESRFLSAGLAASLLPPVLLIVAVLGSILGGLASPTEAAGIGALGAVMLSGYRADPARGKPILLAGLALPALLLLTALFDLRPQRQAIPPSDWIAIGAAVLLCLLLANAVAQALLRLYRTRSNGSEQRVLVEVVRGTTQISSMVFIILAGASLFSLTFRGLGGDFAIERFLANLPGGVWSAMLLVMAVMFLLGFFLDFLEIVFIVVPLVAPVLLAMEIEPGVALSPVWLGVMMALNLQTSFLTPPFGFALFYLRGVAPKQIATADIYRGVMPFVLIQLLALALLALFPGLATWLPEALFG